jgi:F-type H+-transporting ATPase subunit b
MDIGATLLGQALAFAILIWFTFKFIWPPLLGAIEERQKRIADGLAAAERAKQELQVADQRVVDELKQARQDAQLILERAQGQANQIVDKAKEDAVGEVQKQRAAAQAEIANLSHAAREELRQQVSALAVLGAEKILKREIDQNRHRELLTELAAEL